MIAFLLALAMTPSLTCPMTIGVSRDGTIYSSRFNAWYKTSSKTLEGVLHGGCYNDANPTPVTSVRLLLVPKAPKSRVDLVLSILEKDGWKRQKISIEPWNGKEPAPH
jgi:hypothetical protein